MSANCSSEGCGHSEEAHTEPAIFPPCEGTNWPPARSTGDRWWPKVQEVCPCRGFQ